MIVVDTNVMVRLLMGGESGAEAVALYERDPEWAAPPILTSELRNALLGFVRRGDLTSEQAKLASDNADMILDDRVAMVASAEIFDVALECRLTAYDAEFVVLARTLGVPLVTLDGGILRGAPDVAVSLTNAGGPAAGLTGHRSLTHASRRAHIHS